MTNFDDFKNKLLKLFKELLEMNFNSKKNFYQFSQIGIF